MVIEPCSPLACAQQVRQPAPNCGRRFARGRSLARAAVNVSRGKQIRRHPRTRKCIGSSPSAKDRAACKAQRLRQGREECKVAAIRGKKTWVPSAKPGTARNAWRVAASGAQYKFVASQRRRGGFRGARNRLTRAPARTLGPRRAPCLLHVGAKRAKRRAVLNVMWNKVGANHHVSVDKKPI